MLFPLPGYWEASWVRLGQVAQPARKMSCVLTLHLMNDLLLKDTGSVQKHSLQALSANSLCLCYLFWMRVILQCGGCKQALREVLGIIGLRLSSDMLSSAL